MSEYKNIINYVVYVYDKYLLEDPLKNKKNATRILKLKFPIKKIQNKNGTKKWQKIKQNGGFNYDINLIYYKYIKYKTKYYNLKNI